MIQIEKKCYSKKFKGVADEAYDVVTLGGNKGDKSKTKKGEEDYEDEKDELHTPIPDSLPRKKLLEMLKMKLKK